MVKQVVTLTHWRTGGRAVLALIALLALLVSGGATPAASEQTHQQDQTPHTYRIEGVSTREQRTAITRTGAAIEHIEADAVEAIATTAEVRRIRRLGFEPEQFVLALDFPPADAAYHNFTEMVAAIDQAAAAYPSIVQKFSIGRSYENRELWAAKISDNVAVDRQAAAVLFGSAASTTAASATAVPATASGWVLREPDGRGHPRSRHGSEHGDRYRIGYGTE